MKRKADSSTPIVLKRCKQPNQPSYQFVWELVRPHLFIEIIRDRYKIENDKWDARNAYEEGTNGQPPQHANMQEFDQEYLRKESWYIALLQKEFGLMKMMFWYNWLVVKNIPPLPLVRSDFVGINNIESTNELQDLIDEKHVQ